MAPLLLSDIERAVRRSWAADTCAPEGRSRWTAGNPSFGQCGVTAMVLNDLLGGELLRGEVLVDGKHDDYHWWNRLASGVEVDLTREQFGPQQVIGGGVTVARGPASAWRRLREEYELLRGRVLRELGISETDLPEPVPPTRGQVTAVAGEPVLVGLPRRGTGTTSKASAQAAGLIS